MGSENKSEIAIVLEKISALSDKFKTSIATSIASIEKWIANKELEDRDIAQAVEARDKKIDRLEKDITQMKIELNQIAKK